jgi:phosphoadenosine phosphosulfate reductase
MENIEKLNNLFTTKDAEEVLKYFLEKFGERIAFATSFSIEDQVITQMIASINKNAKIFTLDTGRLPYETYKLIELTNEKYDINIDIYFPNYQLVEEMVKEKGINLFYNSVEDRKRCCYVRKIEPLRRALTNLEVWITGLRREQSVTRNQINLVEYDENYKVIKINPLYDWTESRVWEYIKKNNIPYSNLYDQNYASIGCAPCTRPVKDGETVRDGRWWWEKPDTKECGLHIKPIPVPSQREG